MTIYQFKTQSINALKETSPSPQLDTEVLLEYCLKLSKTQLLLDYKKELLPEQENWLLDAVSKRKQGLPVAYITGHKEFYGYDFIVSPAVLIPKPDTEILVERGIEIILEKMEAHPNQILTVCDMCTGSGCIALAVLRTLAEVYKIPESRLPKFTLVDISPAALEIAEKNVSTLGNLKERIHLVRSNLFEQFPKEGGWTFDVILTNPPYIPHSMVEELLKDGRSEPRLALNGDVTLTGDAAVTETGEPADDGLEIIKNLIPQAKNHLSPMGLILMETGEYNAEATAEYAASLGFKSKIHQDLEGQLRVVELS